jgi:predicted DCC family thiol-disulfide oxidoreductase YuxK
MGMKKPPFNKAMLYDDNCPLCKAYTKFFVRSGFLQAQNRVAFSKVSQGEFDIDWNRARHEIPLVDRDTKKVVYGIDALTEVLQQKIFFVSFFMKIKFVYWFFKKLYKLISYNRRLIVAHTGSNQCGFDCRPDYNFKYRLLLILILMTLNWALLSYTTAQTRLPVVIITLSLATPIPLFFLFNTKANLLDVATHFSIITFILAVLLFLTTFADTIFWQVNLPISAAGLAITGIVFLKQLIQRIHFMKTTVSDKIQ